MRFNSAFKGLILKRISDPLTSDKAFFTKYVTLRL